MTIINNILMIAITRGGWLRVSDGGKEAGAAAGVSLSPLNGSSQHPCCTLHTAHCPTLHSAHCTSNSTTLHCTALNTAHKYTALCTWIMQYQARKCASMKCSFLDCEITAFFAVFWLLLFHCIALHCYQWLHSVWNTHPTSTCGKLFPVQ